MSPPHRLSETLRSAQIGVWEINLQTGKVVYDEIAEALYGFEPGTFPDTQEAADARVEPEDRPRILAARQRAFETRTDLHIEYRVILPHGRLRWVASTAQPQFDASGRPLRLGGILIDITARKQAEAERGAALARVSTVLKAAPIGLAFYDQALRFAHLNQALADILGISVEQAVGKTQWEVIPQFAPLLVPPIQRVLATGEPVRDQELQLEVNGQRRVLLVSAYPVTPELASESPIEGVGAVMLDITQEKETRGRLEEAIRTRDEFLATLSHELRTPLTAILGYANMLRTGALPKDQVERAAEVIERNARSQARLVEDLLDANRIVTGRMRLELQPTALEPLIREVVDSLRPAALAKSLSIRVRCEPVSPLLADADRLRQVVWNLVSNSIKFTPENGKVNVKLSGAAGQVRLVVEDTGIGIPQSFLSHVFERFRQADAGSTRAHGGLGLGLAIVKNLVELHGGSASAESPGPGKGTRVTVVLPFLAPTAAYLADDPESPTGDPPGR